ncbi:hypothetical protein F320042A7_22000 [Blautia producta]
MNWHITIWGWIRQGNEKKVVFLHISIIIDSGNKMQTMESTLRELSVVMNENREEPLNGSKEYYTGFNRRQDYYPERI